MRKTYPPVVVGSRYGRWVVRSASDPMFYGGYPHSRWQCACDCGTIKIVKENSLKNGKSTSCGCLTIERTKDVHTKHGRSRSPEYRIWTAMIQRCHNPRNSRFKDYGGRGIIVCQEWRESFDAFFEHMGMKPSSRHSIDRIKNDKPYGPRNCKWSLPHTQMTNRRNSFYVDVEGQQIALSDLAQSHHIPANTLRGRLVKGWPLDRALNEPVRPKGVSRKSA